MDMDGGGSAPPARPRPGRVALLVAGVVVVVLAAGLGLGVALGRGKGDNAAAVAGAEATTGSTGQEARGTGAAGGGADGQAGSGGGGTGGGGTSGGTTTKTTSRTTTATSTTTGATTTGASTTTTTTEMPLAFADPPSGGAQASCTPSKFGGYDFTVRFQVVALFNRSGTIHYQWGRGRDDVRVDSVGTQTVDGRRYVQFNDSISGSVPSRTDTVVDHLHILDPPSVATTVTVTHSICFG